ncbi:energy transducer TonB [Ancylomarina longa]|uniref:Energy transducer TonB n=1 Tax=Ancylomarina longa TaxID=2487017 RepID=A0A434AXC1_9BACT|nr:energy transducer TonB [Ancylomarina longa]RUT79047.1 energy transducer TonB [Ancylomarina longa]
MEVKKNPRYDLEKKRGLFLEIGFLLSFLFVLLAFEYRVPTKEVEVLTEDLSQEIEDIVPVTIQERNKPKELPKIKPLELTQLILADDDDDVPDLEIEDSDANEDDSYQIAEVTEPEEEVEDIPFVRVEFMPIFNPSKNKTYEEGIRDLFITMQKMAKYPVIAQENGIEGKVFVKFIVTKTGEIANVMVVRSIDPALDREAIRVVQNLPKFKPGLQRNRPVSVWFSGYISFVLQ